jgi:N-acylneuraminate cytidylyltransferase
VTATAKPLDWMFTLSKSNQLLPQARDRSENRQDALPLFVLNGAIYISDLVELIRNDFNLVRNDSIGFVMSKVESIDIDDQFDFDVAEHFLRKQSGVGKNCE